MSGREPRLARPYRDVLRAAHACMAPGIPFRQYFALVRRYQRERLAPLQAQVHEPAIIEPEQAAAHPDNSARYERCRYVYEGMEAVYAMRAARRRVCFLGWHQGANVNIIYGLVRRFPRIAVFTRQTEQYGRTFTYSTQLLGPLMLAKMRALLKADRPLLHYIDGIPIGQTFEMSLLGSDSHVSRAPIEFLCAVPGIALVPFSTWYDRQGSVRFRFHPVLAIPSPGPGRARAVAENVIGLLTDHLRQHGPAQVIPRYLVLREQMAGMRNDEGVREQPEAGDET